MDRLKLENFVLVFCLCLTMSSHEVFAGATTRDQGSQEDGSLNEIDQEVLNLKLQQLAGRCGTTTVDRENIDPVDEIRSLVRLGADPFAKNKRTGKSALEMIRERLLSFEQRSRESGLDRYAEMAVQCYEMGLEVQRAVEMSETGREVDCVVQTDENSGSYTISTRRDTNARQSRGGVFRGDAGCDSGSDRGSVVYSTAPKRRVEKQEPVVNISVHANLDLADMGVGHPKKETRKSESDSSESSAEETP